MIVDLFSRYGVGWMVAAKGETALERMRSGAPGSYGYSVFSVSKGDVCRLCDVHLEYVRAMQTLIAASQPGGCVGLYCAQPLDLARSDNVLAEAEAGPGVRP